MKKIYSKFQMILLLSHSLIAFETGTVSFHPIITEERRMSDDHFEELPLTLSTRKHQTSLCFKLGDNHDLQLGIALSTSLDSGKDKVSRSRSAKPCLILTGDEMKSEIEKRASNFIIQSFPSGNASEKNKLQILPSYFNTSSIKGLSNCFEDSDHVLFTEYDFD
jgi:hypothetical protein